MSVTRTQPIEKSGGSVKRRLKPGVLKCPKCRKLLPPKSENCPDHLDLPLIYADPLIGKVIAHQYRLDKHIGRGGMADVYVARHITRADKIAVKILNTSKQNNAHQLKRFLHEAKMQSLIIHPNSVKIYEYGQCDRYETFYVSMEFIEGQTLRELVEGDGPLPIHRVASIGIEMLKALSAAHDEGLLHRDLKPHNVMHYLSEEGVDVVKVFDFGGRRIEPSADAPALTTPGTLFGTPAYMSPEQAQGFPLDHRSDIYSASVVLLFLILGRSPFRGKSIGETLSFVLHKPAPIAEALKKFGPHTIFAEILAKGLERDLHLRYQNAEEMIQALSDFV